MKEIYQMTKEELLDIYPDREGLTEEKALQIRKETGENILEETSKKSAFTVFLEQFADLLVIILIAAAIISMVSGNVESTIVIFVVILLNAVLGTIQYVKAEKSLDSLKALSSPHAKVLRNGVRKEIPSKDVVPGDILMLEAGDMVVADGRILENFSLQVNESSLTGESTNVDKKEVDILENVALGDRINMVYSGSLVTYGRAKILITGTGMNTEMGKIAGLMNETKEKKTPLQRSLDHFSKNLAIVIMIISVLVFGLRIWQGEAVLDSLMFAVALAVAAIPEALSSIVTIVQAMGTRKMAYDNAIMKELKAVESLGCVSVICSDKTGTLTQNKMTVTDVYVGGKVMKPEEMDLKLPLHRYFLYTAILNNDSSIDTGKDQTVTIHTRDGRVYTGLFSCQSHSVHVFDDAKTLVRDENTCMVILDEPVKSKADVNALGIFNGDFVAVEPRMQLTPNGYLKSRFIDDKAAVACSFTLLKYLKDNNLKPKYRTLLAFPYTEEIGMGGTYVPEEVSEYAAIDIGLIGPDYDGDEFKVSICAKDNAAPYDYDLTNRMIGYAQKAGCDYAVDVFYRYGTDGNAAVRAGNNLRSCAFGMAVYCSHGMERTHLKGLENTMNLLIAYVLDI